MKDKIKDRRTGLTLEVNTDYEIPDSIEGRIRSVNTEYTRLLGIISTQPSENVIQMILQGTEATLRLLVRLARMDEDEIQRELRERMGEISKSFAASFHQPSGSFSQN